MVAARASVAGSDWLFFIGRAIDVARFSSN
jgi:hypothetical protein